MAGAVGVYDDDTSVDKVILGGGNGDACIKYTTQYSMEFVNVCCTMITNTDATELQKFVLLDNFVTCVRERENLFAKSDNNIASNITQYTMAGCQGSICLSMLAAYDKKTIIANVSKKEIYKNRNMRTK